MRNRGIYNASLVSFKTLDASSRIWEKCFVTKWARDFVTQVQHVQSLGWEIYYECQVRGTIIYTIPDN